MKKILALFAFAVMMMSSGYASAEAKQDFDLVNRTGYQIDQVYVSPSAANDWENDVLGSDALGDGQKVHIKFHRSATSCSWDLKVVYDDKEEAVWTKINLCEVEKITVRWNKSTGVSSATFD